jgi:WD domain, G-beta repeat
MPNTDADLGGLQHFDDLRKHPSCTDIILDLLDFIETDLLRMDPDNRAKISDIVAKVRTFHHQCEADIRYCTNRMKPVTTRVRTDLSELKASVPSYSPEMQEQLRQIVVNRERDSKAELGDLGADPAEAPGSPTQSKRRRASTQKGKEPERMPTVEEVRTPTLTARHSMHEPRQPLPEIAVNGATEHHDQPQQSPDDTTVQLWDTATGAARGAVEGHSGSVRFVAFSPNSQLVASGSDDKTVQLGDPTTGEIRSTLESNSNYASSISSPSEIESLFSDNSSLVSSKSSTYQFDNVVTELVHLLLNEKELKLLYALAMTKVRVEKFQRNLKRLLQQYGRSLLSEASKPLESQAARLVIKSAGPTADKIGKAIMHEDENDKRIAMQKLKDERTLKAPQLEAWLGSQDSRMPFTGRQNKFVQEDTKRTESPSAFNEEINPSHTSDSDDSDDSDELDGLEIPEQSKLHTLEKVESFMISGQAYKNLCEEFEQWLNSGEENLVTKRMDSHGGPLRASDGVIRAAARGSQEVEEVVQHLSLSESVSAWDGSKLVRLTPWTLVPKLGVSDWFKGMIESLAQRPIHWWPLQERIPLCPEGSARLSWDCVSTLLSESTLPIAPLAL